MIIIYGLTNPRKMRYEVKINIRPKVQQHPSQFLTKTDKMELTTDSCQNEG